MLTVEQIAEVCHEANRALQRQTGEVVNFPWENTSIALRDSTIEGVQGFIQGNTPEDSHNQWILNRVEAGWMYGIVKDFAAKTHPCLVSYEELPPLQKAKDTLFGAIVKALAGR